MRMMKSVFLSLALLGSTALYAASPDDVYFHGIISNKTKAYTLVKAFYAVDISPDVPIVGEINNMVISPGAGDEIDESEGQVKVPTGSVLPILKITGLMLKANDGTSFYYGFNVGCSISTTTKSNYVDTLIITDNGIGGLTCLNGVGVHH